MSVLNWFSLSYFLCHCHEEGWVVDVGRALIPLIEETFWGLQVVPSVSSFGDLVIDFLKEDWSDGGVSDFLYFIS
jgi:hypothetical protein